VTAMTKRETNLSLIAMLGNNLVEREWWLWWFASNGVWKGTFL